MNQTRRSFLRNSAMGLGALAFASPALQALAAVKYKKLVGVQLYSVRDDMRKDPQATLNALAEMGYKYVEHANYIGRKFYGWEAKEFKTRTEVAHSQLLVASYRTYPRLRAGSESNRVLLGCDEKETPRQPSCRWYARLGSCAQTSETGDT